MSKTETKEGVPIAPHGKFPKDGKLLEFQVPDDILALAASLGFEEPALSNDSILMTGHFNVYSKDRTRRLYGRWRLTRVHKHPEGKAATFTYIFEVWEMRMKNEMSACR